MLKGDIGVLANKVGVSRSTIYRIAGKIGLDLTPVHGRCDKTVDFISGETLSDERNAWIEMATEKIISHRTERKVKHEQNS